MPGDVIHVPALREGIINNLRSLKPRKSYFFAPDEFMYTLANLVFRGNKIFILNSVARRYYAQYGLQISFSNLGYLEEI
jgi:hypothetical protein